MKKTLLLIFAFCLFHPPVSHSWPLSFEDLFFWRNDDEEEEEVVEAVEQPVEQEEQSVVIEEPVEVGPPAPLQDFNAYLTIKSESGNSSSLYKPLFRDGDKVIMEMSLFVRDGEAPELLKVEVSSGNTKKEYDFKQEGFRYQLEFPINDIFQVQEETTDESVVVFRTTKSEDTIYFMDAAKQYKKNLPENIALFHDENERNESYSKTEEEFDSYKVPGHMLFEAGLLQRVKIEIKTVQGQVIEESIIRYGQVPDWIYYSGHYPYDTGGFLGGSNISPFDVEGKGFEKHLEAMIFAACYAVDINNYNGKIKGARAGVNGSEWWKKFRGTVLGYYGSAPSRGTDAAIAKKFAYRVSKLPEGESSSSEHSIKLAQTWMRVNTVDYRATQASAIDSSGNYYFIPRRSVRLRNTTFRTVSGKPWIVQSYEDWQDKNNQMFMEGQIQEHVVNYLKEVSRESNNGKPLSYDQVKNDEQLKVQAREAGLDPESSNFKDFLRGQLEYEARIFYDVPSNESYFEAATYLGSQRALEEVVTTDEIKDHFTPDQPRPRAKLLDSENIESMRFIEYAVRVMLHPTIQKDREKTEELLRNHFELNSRENGILDKLFNS